MSELFGVLDLNWVLRQLTGGNPVPFVLWSAFAGAVGFALGTWYRKRRERAMIEEQLGRVREFARVSTLDDLIHKADELAVSASDEVMQERAARIAELDAKVGKLARELDEKTAECKQLRKAAEASGVLEVERLREDNEQLRRDLARATSSAWYEKSREGAARKQARGRFSRLTPTEAGAVMSLYVSGARAAESMDARTLASLIVKKAAEMCPENLLDQTPTVCLSSRTTTDLNTYMDEFECLFGKEESR